MLDRINTEIRAKTKDHNQWTSTAQVIEWFKNLPDKNSLTFLVFDVVDFYPSITQELLCTCLQWAKNYTKIKDIEYDTIIHARRTLLFDHRNRAWVKKEAKKEFDVLDGSLRRRRGLRARGPIRIVTTQKQNQHIQYWTL